MKLLKTFILFTLLLPWSILAEDTDSFESELQKDFKKLAIKGGLGLSRVQLERGGSRDHFVTPALNTQLSIYMGDFELTANGIMSFGKINELDYELDGRKITGVGKVLDLSLSPILKYETNLSFNRGHWPIYIGFGPAWSLYSISFDNNSQVSEYDYDINTDEFKLSYTTFGHNIVIGVEEETSSKSLHPVYIELVYSYRKSRKLSLVDTEEFEEVEVAHEQDDKSFTYHSVMINMGITFF